MFSQCFRQWLEYSFYYYENLQSYSGSGISDLDGYIFSNISEDNVNVSVTFS